MNNFMRYFVWLVLLAVCSNTTGANADDAISRNQIALQAANAVYDMPDINWLRSWRPIEDAFKTFFQHAPKGYRIAETLNAPESGLKAVILAPIEEADASTPWIVSIAGTETLIDWLADGHFGADQYDGLAPLRDWAIKNHLAERELIVTGHSLGGGLAQAFAYAIERFRLKLGADTGRVHLVTWNAFGAEALIERTMGFDPQIERGMDIYNYYVAGEPISVLGRHLGPTYELKAPHRRQFDKLMPRAVYRHKIASILQTVFEGPGRLETARRKAPPLFKVINKASTQIEVFTHAADDAWDLREGIQIRKLGRELKRLAERGTRSREAQAAYNYLHGITVHLLSRLTRSEQDRVRSEWLQGNDRKAFDGLF
jgi:hypothetical protein